MSEVKIAIKGENAGLIGALNEAKAAVAEATESMASSFEKVAGAFEMINVAMVAFTAVLAGGKAFSEAIAASAGAAYSALELGRQLGITATQASVLKVAMDENFVSTEAVQGASSKIAQTLKTNENAFKELGVQTRDSNGNFRNSFDIMQDVNSRLATFKEGTDRNVEGMKIYGRSWTSVMDAVRLTGPAMEDAKEKADSLGLTVGVEGVQQALAYKGAMASVHTVFDAIEKAIGDALVPVLTELGNWFASVGPQAVQLIKSAITDLVAIFQGLEVVGISVIEGLELLWEGFADVLIMVAKVAKRALHLDFAGAAAEWSKGLQQIESDAKAHAQNIQDAWLHAADVIDQIGHKQTDKQTPIADTGGAASTGGDGRAKSRTGDWETALKDKEAAYQEEAAQHGQLLEFSKQQEIDYWQNILSTQNVSEEERKSIHAKIAADMLSIDKSKLEGSLATLKNEESAHGKSLNDRLAAEMKYADAVKGIYGVDSKQYADAQKAIVDTKRKLGDQLDQLNNLEVEQARNRELAEINSAEEAAKTAYQNHQISLAQLTALDEQYEAQRYAIKEQALTHELALINPDEDPVAYAKKMAQIEQVSEQHSAAMQKISDKAAIDQTKAWNGVFNQIGRGFQQTIEQFLRGTASIGQSIRGLFQDIASSVISALASMAAKNAMVMLESMIMGKTAAMTQIKANAAAGAAAAYSAVSAIPVVGPFLAPAAAAVAYGGILAFGGDVSSAAGGYDIPAGVNPMTQLHQNEMVLPQSLADPIRAMAAGGQGGSGGVTAHFNISAMDGPSLAKFMNQNASVFSDALKRINSRFMA